MGVGHRARGRRRGGRRLRARRASGDPRGVRDVRRRRGLSMGGAHAVAALAVRHRDRAARRRHRRPRQPLRAGGPSGLVSGDVGHRRLRRTLRRARARERRRRARGSVGDRPRRAGPSTARARSSAR
jgi:hypothetical protein